MTRERVVVAGAGVFGAAAALELAGRGYAVDLIDPGPLPHPLAASTDISKVIRMDYGPDEDYLTAMETALDRWRRWNADLANGSRGSGTRSTLAPVAGWMTLKG